VASLELTNAKRLGVTIPTAADAKLETSSTILVPRADVALRKKVIFLRPLFSLKSIIKHRRDVSVLDGVGGRASHCHSAGSSLAIQLRALNCGESGSFSASPESDSKSS